MKSLLFRFNLDPSTFLYIWFVFVLSSSSLYGQSDLTQTDITQEEITLVEEFSATSFSTLIPDQSYSPLSSFNGVTYFVWVNPDRYPMITTIDGDKTETFRLDPNDGYKARNDGHHKFSLGIDNDGYIHVTGDMHNHPIAATSHLSEPYLTSYCMYWVSDKPEDISSFTFMGTNAERTIQGSGCSYHYFVNDNNGVLYFAARKHISVPRSHDGYGLQKYDTETKTWRQLGALPSWKSSATFPMIAWDNLNSYIYYSMRGDVRFDKNNRMHFVTTIRDARDSENPIGGVPKSMTHVIYGYSDDGGETFFKADSTPIGLPMRLLAGSNQADFPVGPVEFLSMPASVTFNKDNEQIVSFVQISQDGTNEQAKYVQWDDQTGWSTPANLPLNANGWDKQYTDGRGVITLSSLSKGFYRTLDLKETGVSYSTPFFCVDRRHLLNTGELRGVSSSGSTIKVLRMETSLSTRLVVFSAINDIVTRVNKNITVQLKDHFLIDNEKDDPTFTVELSNGDTIPAWLHYNSSLKTISGVPTNIGTFEIKVTAQKSAGESTTMDFIIEVEEENTAPYVYNAIPDTVIDFTKSFVFNVSDLFFKDNNKTDELFYTAKQESGDELPWWLSFSSSLKQFTGLPLTDDSLGVVLTATDQSGISASDTFSITFRGFNKAPYVYHPIPDTVVDINESFSYTLPDSTFIDDNLLDILTYSANLETVSYLPYWFKFSSTDKQFSRVPTSETVLSIVVTASDIAGNSASDTFRIDFRDFTSSNIINSTMKSIDIFPNPAQNVIHIVSEANFSNLDAYQLVSLSGEQVLSGTLASNTIDVSKMEKGIYILELRVVDGLFYEKIVIE